MGVRLHRKAWLFLGPGNPGAKKHLHPADAGSIGRKRNPPVSRRGWFLTLVSNEPGEYVCLLDGTLYSNVPDSRVQEMLTQALRNWQ